MTFASQRGMEIHKDLRPCSAAIPGCSTPSIPACVMCSGCERTNREVNPNGSQRGPGRPCTIHTGVDQVQRFNFDLGLLIDEINMNWSIIFSPYYSKDPVFVNWEVDFKCIVPGLHGQNIGMFYFTQAAENKFMVSIIQDSKRPTQHVIKHCF